MSLRALTLAVAGAGLALGAMVTTAPVAAQISGSILAARQAGQIGERFDGYLGLVVTPPDALRRQVESINIRRRALYSTLASRRGVSPREVGITAGCRLLAGVGAGESYMLGDGVWRQLGPGQQAPVPSYCGQY